MAKWWKRWTMLAGGLTGMASWLTPAPAQVPGAQPPPAQNGPAEPLGTPSSEFPRLGDPPPPQQGPPPNPLSYDYRGRPNGFSEEEYYREPDPYVLKFKGEYLLWNVGKGRLPTTLATQATVPDLATGVGAIADPGTVSLLGPGDYGYNRLPGGRATLGIAPGCLPPIEISGFWVDRTRTLLNVSSNGSQNSPAIARPFQAPNLPSLNGLGQQVVLSAGFPGFLRGAINADADINLWGIEPNVFLNVGQSDCASLDVIVGFRHTELFESIRISNSLSSINNGLFISFNPINNNGFPPGFTSSVTDSFRGRNYFNGGTIGIRPMLNWSIFTLSSDLKLSMGCTRQVLDIEGSSSLRSPDGAVQTVPGGLLAVASNSGSSSRTEFTVIPELNINFGFNITRCFKIFATYNIFYWSDVVRPGDQLNSRVDSRQVPTDPTFNAASRPTDPVRPFRSGDFWGHGLGVGVELGF